MKPSQKATSIDLFSLKTAPMRAFHMTWFAFFMAFFGWFGIAPLMAVVREDLNLSKAQIGNTIIASVLITVLVRFLIGPLCDRWGPRLCYTVLLTVGSLPVMLIGLANSYETFLLFRLAIGAIGASFVITQYHTSMMFAPNCVGTANATSAGWGNLGGGVTQMVMPLILAGILMLGVSPYLGWRLAMAIPGVILFLTGIAYYFVTQDCPEGNYKDLRAAGKMQPYKSSGGWLGSIKEAGTDMRVWALFVCYAACFGVELTINNVAALYFHDRFELSVGTAGLIAGLFGLMNIFARTLGGYFSDIFARRWSLSGRVYFLFATLACEGIALMVFAQMGMLAIAVATMIVFSLFVQMAEGATYGIVPFVNKKHLGMVAGIVGAGGNAGAVLAGFLFRAENISTQHALFYLGCVVAVCSVSALAVRFAPAQQAEEAQELQLALDRRAAEKSATPALAGD
jgi:NNP family nitrate/nitrite transporter-like MFS transporter